MDRRITMTLAQEFESLKMTLEAHEDEQGLRELEACKELSKIPGMDKCPNRLVRVDYNNYPGGRGQQVVSIAVGKMKQLNINPKRAFQLDLGPYLRIQDDSEWSSAKILAKTGYVVNFGLHEKRWHIEKEISDCETSVLFLGEVLQCDNPKLGELELVYNMAVIALHKLSPKSLILPEGE